MPDAGELVYGVLNAAIDKDALLEEDVEAVAQQVVDVLSNLLPQEPATFIMETLDDQVLRARDGIASSLEQVAKRIRELPLRTDYRAPQHKDYTGFVEDVLHHLRTGNGNLVAEHLVRAAADAHNYSRGF